MYAWYSVCKCDKKRDIIIQATQRHQCLVNFTYFHVIFFYFYLLLSFVWKYLRKHKSTVGTVCDKNVIWIYFSFNTWFGY